MYDDLDALESCLRNSYLKPPLEQAQTPILENDEEDDACPQLELDVSVSDDDDSDSDDEGSKASFVLVDPLPQVTTTRVFDNNGPLHPDPYTTEEMYQGRYPIPLFWEGAAPGYESD
jgi:hypothetical protein